MMAAKNNINIIKATAMGTIMPTVRRAPTTEGIKEEKQHIYIYMATLNLKYPQIMQGKIRNQSLL